MRLKCNRQVKVENVSPGPTAGELNVPYSFPSPSTSFIRHSQLMSIDCQDNIMRYVPDSFSSSLQEEKKNRIIKKTKTLLHSGIITRVPISPNHWGVSRIELPLLKSYIDSIYSNTGKNN